MDLTKLQYFVVTAESTTMQRAAERLYVSQSTLSVSIRALEREMGITLFEKRGRNLALTDAGKICLLEAKGVLSHVALFQEHMSMLQDGKQNKLMIITEALDISDLFRPVAEHLLHDLILSQPSVPRHEVRSLLFSRRAHAALTLTDDTDSKFQSTLLLEDQIMALMHENHPLAGYGELDFFQLDNQDIVSMPKEYAYRTQCEAMYLLAGFKINRVHEVMDFRSVPGSVMQQHGIAFIPRYTWNSMSNELPDCLRAIPINDPACVRRIYLTQRRDEPVDEPLKSYIDILHRFIAFTTINGHYPNAP